MDPEENIDLDGFLFGLLGKRKRRLAILSWWHSVHYKQCYDTIKTFVEHILYHPIQLSLFNDYFCIFGDRSFAIHYEWLTAHERHVIAQLLNQRKLLFRTVSSNLSGSFFVTGCRQTVVLHIYNRRELVRDFCFMGVARKDISAIFRLLMCKATQELLLESDPDPFLRQLQFALQGRKSIDDLICVF